MNKPLMAFAGLMAAGATAVGVYVALPGGGEEEVAQHVETPTSASATQLAGEAPAPALTPGPGLTLWRWGNVTVLVPADSDIYPLRLKASPVEHPPDGGPMINLIRGDDSGLTIDALTGVVLWSSVIESDQKAFDAIVQTIAVEGSTDFDSLPWPYAAKEPESEKVKREGLRFWEPDPASGLIVNLVISDGVGSARESYVLENTKSRRAVDAHTGEVVAGYGQVAPEDQTAFDRWTESVELAVD